MPDRKPILICHKARTPPDMIYEFEVREFEKDAAEAEFAQDILPIRCITTPDGTFLPIGIVYLAIDKDGKPLPLRSTPDAPKPVSRKILIKGDNADG